MRRWFQFRLRTLFVVMTLACGICAWGVEQVREYQAEQRAIVQLGPSNRVEELLALPMPVTWTSTKGVFWFT